MNKKREKQTVDSRGKDFLTEAEMKRFLEAARHGRRGSPKPDVTTIPVPLIFDILRKPCAGHDHRFTYICL